MTRAEWIDQLREHASSQGKAVSDDMLKAANSLYDAYEPWKAAGFSEEEAWQKVAWLKESIGAGDVGIPLATANMAADLLESLENVEGEEAAEDREELRNIIDESVSNAHEIAASGITARRRR